MHLEIVSHQWLNHILLSVLASLLSELYSKQTNYKLFGIKHEIVYCFHTLRSIYKIGIEKTNRCFSSIDII